MDIYLYLLPMTVSTTNCYEAHALINSTTSERLNSPTTRELIAFTNSDNVTILQKDNPSNYLFVGNPFLSV